jgi:dTDP-4-dehydrorhamnose 3,5-epimerase-like enzyme
MHQKHTFHVIGDERGSLISLESCKNIPFEIKRVYYIFDTKQDVRRGFHAHRELEQILICTSGSCDILLDDGKNKNIITLNKRNEGLYIPNNIWHEMFNFSQDCVLMALASDHYDESDYIRNYDDFLLFVNGNNGK